MIIQIDKKGTIEGFQNIIKSTLDIKDVKSLLILSCDYNGFTPDNIDPVLRKIEVPVLGGIFPCIIDGKKILECGNIVVGISKEIEVHVIHELSDDNKDYDEILDKKIAEIGNMRTMLVFVDGFSKRISAFIESLFNILGLEINYIGGGAGSLSMEQKPCILTNEGLIIDGAVLALLNLESGVGVSHGWESISGPYKVTESDRNIVKTLDWQPAFEIYKKVVEKHSGKVFSADNFFDIAKAYPFGITKIGAERVVRDPFVVGENNSMVCVGEVPEGAFVDILNGNESSIIEAAGKALALAKTSFKVQTDQRISIFMDCISRVLFLDDKFSEELTAVHDESQPLIGACTIGEIANSGSDYLEFYNKTSVVAIMEAV